MIVQSFDEVFTFEAIYRAHLRGRLSKRDKITLVKFESHMLENVYNLYQSLHKGVYRTSGYSHFTVYEPKKREIQTLRYADRVVQHVLCDEVLSPYFTKRAIIDNAVCQVGKGTHFALDRFQSQLRSFTAKHGNKGYILKCDILKYFPGIPHDTLKNLFCAHIRDDKIKKLLCCIIDSYNTSEDYLKAYGYDCLNPDPVKTGRGVPIGNQTSQVFGMFYLNSVDRLVKEQLRVKIYSRYMDDFVIVHEDKEFLKSVLAKITQAVHALGLKFNSKTQIFPLKNGVTYLGFRFFVRENGKVVKTVKRQTKDRLRWRARLLKKAVEENLVTPERIRQSLSAFHGHLKHSKNYRLEKELYVKLLKYACADGKGVKVLYGKK